jgi:hypothetical protein
MTEQPMTTVFDRKLFGEQNAKTTKGQSKGAKTLILYLAPEKTASSAMGKAVNVCPYATKGCAASCLFTAGRGVMAPVYEARVAKTVALFRNRQLFLDKLAKEIRSGIKRAKRDNMTLAVRLNGTSDLPFLEMALAPQFPGVQFYAYTKVPPMHDARRHVPNVHLTYSFSEDPRASILLPGLLKSGQNVAVVFNVKRKDALPVNWKGIPVIDGDLDDLRFMDPKGVIVGLRAKGRARKDTSGFVQVAFP